MGLVVPVLTIMFLSIYQTSAGLHSLRNYYTAVSEAIDFPEFTAVGLVDDVQFIYFDSNRMEAQPKTEWIRQNEGKEYWDSQTQIAIGAHQVFKNNIQVAMDRFNQSKSSGVHTFQRMCGCEWDDETGAGRGYDQFGYDGKDFISLDLQNRRWIAPVPQALLTKQKLDSDRAQLEYLENYYTHTCIDWLKKYLEYGRSSLERTVPPEVSLLQTQPSSPVVCHATGFRPREVMISWQKDGQDLHEDVELGDILLNHDGSFQKSSTLSVQSEEWQKSNGAYRCVVQHKSLQQDTVIPLTAGNVKSNYGKNPRQNGDSDNRIGIIIGCVVGLPLLIAAAVGFFVWKKSRAGFKLTNTSETDSDNSERPVQKI